MSSLNKIKNLWLNSLSGLDNSYVNALVIVALVLYNLVYFHNINMFIARLFRLSIVRVLFLFLIIYIIPKDPTIALLLAISYLITIDYMEGDKEEEEGEE
jgi:hypothetical protein